MERTNYVSKAKTLMLKTARTAALVIVPLAAAVSAHAGTIVASGGVALPRGNASCSLNMSGSCFGSDQQGVDLGSGVIGLSFFTSGGTAAQFFLSSGSGQTLQMRLADFGIVNGTIPSGTNIPVSWFFTMTPLTGATINSWNLVFELGSSGGLSNYGAASGGGLGGGSVSGASVLTVSNTIASGSTLFETVQLQMSVNVTSPSGEVDVTVPIASTWDFQSVAASSVPEPGSLGLLGAGLAFFGTLIRRRRQQ